MVKIVQRDNPVLRKVADAVPTTEIASSKIKKIISEMKEALDSQKDGVAIAAPQIGEPWRIFVISKEIINTVIEKEKKEKDKTKQAKIENEVFINPTITKLSKDKKWAEEGCLSVRYLYGKVRRSNKAAVRAFDENGKVFERGASGLLAQVFQHEVDHLNGILFTDMAKDLEELPPDEEKPKKKL
jgi:peptide deformylase